VHIIVAVALPLTQAVAISAAPQSESAGDPDAALVLL
jgi:hypothetical protein